MDSRIVDLPPLPVFENGYPLGANDLNRFTLVQEYVQRRMTCPIPLLPTHKGEITYAFLHTHRYIRYSITIDNQTVKLLVNGKRAVQVATGSIGYTTSGTVDLDGNDLDGQPFALSYNRKITLRWERVSGGTGEIGINYMYESPTTSATLSLPATLPTFTGGGLADKTKLNALSTNTKFLLSGEGFIPNCGFEIQRLGIPGGGNYTVTYYKMRYVHRYFTTRFDIHMGYNPNTLNWHVKINGATVYSNSQSKSGNGEVNIPHTLRLDTNTYGLTVGTWYTVEFYVQSSSWDDFDGITVYWAGQSADNTLPVF